MASNTALETAPTAYSPTERLTAVVALLLALTLIALDQTIVSVAAPVIGKELKLSSSLYSLVLTAYLLGNLVSTPISGKLSDMFGRKPVVLFGLAVFVLGSLLCGLASDGWFLVGARAIKGIGAGVILTTSFASISDLFASEERARYLGLFGAVYGLSSIVGPLLGGFLTDQFGWRSIFLINVPVGLTVIGLILWRMPKLRGAAARGGIDWLGGLSLVISLVSLVLALSLGNSVESAEGFGYPWLSWEIIGLLVISISSFLWFVRVERKATNPILNPNLFANRAFAASNLASLIMGAVFLPVIVFLPIFLVSGLGFSATSGGLSLLPLSLAFAVGNIGGGTLSSRLAQVRVVLVSGGAIATIAYLILGFLVTQQAPLPWVMACTFMLGVGLGPSASLYALSAQNALGEGQAGVASGANNLFRSIGTTLGTALLGTLLTVGLQNGQAYPAAVGLVFFACAALTLVGTLLTLRMAR
jgi:EmrB/QacA subfamily drug resistance transporter